ncbi:hypothetical protein G9A89_001555 [Geosiphon pyriformis]|nr:hypothetical protein G9A89_001555 [Geosiphon pyriformis]
MSSTSSSPSSSPQAFTEDYQQKARGTHVRVQRVKVTPVQRQKSPSVPYDSPVLNRNCTRCKESSNCVKVLSSKLGRIEELVNTLERKTYRDQSMHDPAKKAQIQKWNAIRNTNLSRRGLDLSTISFDDLQKLVAVATNIPFPSLPAPPKPHSIESIISPPTPTSLSTTTTTSITTTKTTTTTTSSSSSSSLSTSSSSSSSRKASIANITNNFISNEQRIIYSEPPQSEFNSAPIAVASSATHPQGCRPPVQAAIALKAEALRKDSGFSEIENGSTQQQTPKIR